MRILCSLIKCESVLKWTTNSSIPRVIKDNSSLQTRHRHLCGNFSLSNGPVADRMLAKHTPFERITHSLSFTSHDWLSINFRNQLLVQKVSICKLTRSSLTGDEAVPGDGRPQMRTIQHLLLCLLLVETTEGVRCLWQKSHCV